MEIEKKETAEMNDATTSDPKNCLYYCSKCSFNIETVSLDENNIEFTCNNKHDIKIEIKEYLNRMKQYNNIKLKKINTMNIKKNIYHIAEIAMNIYIKTV